MPTILPPNAHQPATQELIVKSSKKNIKEFEQLFSSIESPDYLKLGNEDFDLNAVNSLRALQEDNYIHIEGMKIARQLASLRMNYTKDKFNLLKKSATSLYDYIEECYPKAILLMKEYAKLQSKSKANLQLKNQQSSTIEDTINSLIDKKYVENFTGTADTVTNVMVSAEAAVNVTAATDAVVATTGFVVAEAFIVVAAFII